MKSKNYLPVISVYFGKSFVDQSILNHLNSFGALKSTEIKRLAFMQLQGCQSEGGRLFGMAQSTPEQVVGVPKPAPCAMPEVRIVNVAPVEEKNMDASVTKEGSYGVNKTMSTLGPVGGAHKAKAEGSYVIGESITDAPSVMDDLGIDVFSY